MIHSSFDMERLSSNSPWDFENVLDTMEPYWVIPGENFSPIVQDSGSAMFEIEI